MRKTNFLLQSVTFTVRIHFSYICRPKHPAWKQPHPKPAIDMSELMREDNEDSLRQRYGRTVH